MTRTCTICTHPKRAEIEAAVISGVSYRGIASQFFIDDGSLQRHVASHVQASIKQSKIAIEEARGIDVVKQLKVINTITLTILQSARDNGQDGMALFAIDRVLKQIELQSKLLGDINVIEQEQEEKLDSSLIAYMTDEEIETMQTIAQNAQERKMEAEQNIIPMRRNA